MNQVAFSEDSLKQAAALVRRSMLDSMPCPSQCVHEFSPAFQAKMERLISRERLRRNSRKILQRVAVVFLAALFGIGVWLTVDAEARAVSIAWIREVYENSFVYRYFGDKPEEGMQNYEITQLPEGFTQTAVENDENGTMCFKTYQSADDTFLLVYYQFYEGRNHFVVSVDGSKCKREEVLINGIAADFYDYEDDEYANELVWIDENAGVTFLLTGNIEKSNMIQIAESIQAK